MCVKCATFLMKINHKPWRLDVAHIQQEGAHTATALALYYLIKKFNF